MDHGTQRMEEGRTVIVLSIIKIKLYPFLHVNVMCSIWPRHKRGEERSLSILSEERLVAVH
jgi:hypothetical protein